MEARIGTMHDFNDDVHSDKLSQSRLEGALDNLVELSSSENVQ